MLDTATLQGAPVQVMADPRDLVLTAALAWHDALTELDAETPKMMRAVNGANPIERIGQGQRNERLARKEYETRRALTAAIAYLKETMQGGGR